LPRGGFYACEKDNLSEKGGLPGPFATDGHSGRKSRASNLARNFSQGDIDTQKLCERKTDEVV
jgi:hypothetical protein